MAVELSISKGEAEARQSGSPIAALWRIGRSAAPQEPMETCELCGAAIGGRHPHLFHVKEKRIACSCPACAMLMAERPGGRFVRVPEQVRALPHFVMSDAAFESLRVPIDLAFFVIRDGKPGAFYPSPAGATEASVLGDAWRGLVAGNPELDAMRPEVEALLVNRLLGQRMVFVVPIDVCYELVGLMKVHWRGLSGGTEIWKKVNAFFEGLQKRGGNAAAAGGGHA